MVGNCGRKYSTVPLCQSAASGRLRRAAQSDKARRKASDLVDLYEATQFAAEQIAIRAAKYGLETGAPESALTLTLSQRERGL